MTFGLKAKGSVGVLISAYRNNLLSLEEISFIFEVLKTRSDIWLPSIFLDRIWQNLRKPPES